jgi:hypothetical protein
VNDFPRKTGNKEELQKYKLLNIFYNREPEIKLLRQLHTEELTIQRENTKKKYKEWLKKGKKTVLQICA